jgi:beta-galactosidase
VGRAAVAYDPTRLVNIASGGNFWPVGHIADHHNYPDPAFPLEDARFKDFVKVVGEFGGHGWPEPGHLWSGDETKYKLYGNRPTSREEWLGRYTRTIGMLADLKAKGIAAGVYTQTTDVEDEINGLVTYDRRVSKASVQTLLELSRQLGEEIRR